MEDNKMRGKDKADEETDRKEETEEEESLDQLRTVRVWEGERKVTKTCQAHHHVPAQCWEHMIQENIWTREGCPSQAPCHSQDTV